jgi:hypothetical protein
VFGGREAMAIGVMVYRRHIVRVIGRNCFHSRCISWSYRNRGYEARIHRKISVRIVVFAIRLRVNMFGLLFSPGLKNKMQVRAFIMIIFVYSAMNSIANIPPAYSTLNPETSSDSPSDRSKGVRFVSARVETNHIIVRGQVAMASQVCS